VSSATSTCSLFAGINRNAVCLRFLAVLIVGASTRMAANVIYATAHDLPVELVHRILEHAVQQFLEVEPCFAVRLQLLSRTTRLWLLPMIYCVFVVRWPDILSSSHTSTQAFFLKLLTESHEFPAVRAAIKHLVFLGDSGPGVDQFAIRNRLDEWRIESVCLGPRHAMLFLHGTNIVPRSVFLTMPRYGLHALVNNQHTRPRLEPGPDNFSRCALRELEVVEFACLVQPVDQEDTDDGTTPDVNLSQHWAMGRSISINIRWIRILAARRRPLDDTLPTNPPLVARLHLSMHSESSIVGFVELLNVLMVVQGLSIQLIMAKDSDEEASIARELQNALNATGDPVQSRVTMIPVKNSELVRNGEDWARRLRCGSTSSATCNRADIPDRHITSDLLKTERLSMRTPEAPDNTVDAVPRLDSIKRKWKAKTECITC